jgi:hypothetical protein
MPSLRQQTWYLRISHGPLLTILLLVARDLRRHCSNVSWVSRPCAAYGARNSRNASLSRQPLPRTHEQTSGAGLAHWEAQHERQEKRD